MGLARWMGTRLRVARPRLVRRRMGLGPRLGLARWPRIWIWIPRLGLQKLGLWRLWRLRRLVNCSLGNESRMRSHRGFFFVGEYLKLAKSRSYVRQVLQNGEAKAAIMRALLRRHGTETQWASARHHG